MEPEPFPGGSSRGTRLTLVALALFALLAIVAFASRSGFGGSSDARPSDGYVSWAFSVFLVLFVLAIPFTAYAFYVRGREGAVERAKSFKRIVIQNLLTVAFIVGLIAFLIYLRQFRWSSLFGGRRQGSLGDASDAAKAKAGNKQDAFEPVFHWPVAVVAAVLIAALLVTAYVLHRRRVARRGTRVPLDRSIADDLSAEISDAIEDLEAEPDARRAVIAAYARMERVLGRHGLRRRPSQTPYEYLAGVLLDLRAPADAVRRLTDAFERAKFSRQEIGDPIKRDAIGALVAVRAGLEPYGTSSGTRFRKEPATT
jgi:Domain of unknown function (DUF4129)